MKKEKAHWAGIFFPWLPKKLKSIQLKTFSLMWTQWGKGGHELGRLALAYIHYPQCKAAVYMGSTTLCSVMTSIGGMGMAGREIQREEIYAYI